VTDLTLGEAARAISVSADMPPVMVERG